MKKQILLLIISCSLLNHLMAQTAAIPAAIYSIFKNRYPGAKEESWVIEKNFSTVSFIINNRYKTASFENNGQWLLTESKVEYAQLPKAILNSLAKSFPAFKVLEAALVEARNKASQYQLKAVKGDESYFLIYSAGGELLKVEKEMDFD